MPPLHLQYPLSSAGRTVRAFADREWEYFAGPGWPERIMEVEVADRFHAKQGRSIARWTLQRGGRSLTVYLKRHYKLSGWCERAARWFPAGIWSPGLQECANLQWAAERGLPVPKPMAAGELRSAGALQGFIAIAELTDQLGLHEAIPLAQKELPPDQFANWKRGLFAELARLSRQFHGAGAFHQDWYLCHFYIPRGDCSRAAADWKGRVTVIDLHRLKRRRLLTALLRMKDLAQLHYSAIWPGVDAADREWFWESYAEGMNPFSRAVLKLGSRWKAAIYSRNARRTEARPPQITVRPSDTGEDAMDVALCYENVNPARGGCETYIADLARRLARDGHAVHLYASRWDPDALPPLMHYHRIPASTGPRWLRPWNFAAACADALAGQPHDVSIGFDKTWGQDILYPQGGLHSASVHQNTLKHNSAVGRWFARQVKRFDPAARSFRRLERKQYLSSPRPRIAVNSAMVRGYFERYLEIPADEIEVLPSAIDPGRFLAEDRLKRRADLRDHWCVESDEAVGLFVAMNYRLKGLAPLIRSLAAIPKGRKFRIAVVGHPKFERYKRLAESLGVTDRLRFLGFRADPKDCYFAADFLVHPTFYDPCSLVALEALACGLPVITTRFNGAVELFADGREGLVVQDPHDAAELGGAIAKMLDPSLRRSMAAAARLAGKRWTFEMHYQKLIGMMRQVVQMKRAA